MKLLLWKEVFLVFFFFANIIKNVFLRRYDPSSFSRSEILLSKKTADKIPFPIGRSVVFSSLRNIMKKLIFNLRFFLPLQVGATGTSFLYFLLLCKYNEEVFLVFFFFANIMKNFSLIFVSPPPGRSAQRCCAPPL